MPNNLVQIFRILLLSGLASSVLAQTITETLTLSHGLRITGPNAILTFHTNCPNDTIFCCKLDDAEFEICTSPVTYYNLPPGDYSVSIKAQAVKLGQPLEVAIAERNFTITKPVVVEPLTVQGSAQSLGDSVSVTFTANMPATFQCKINDGDFFMCSSPYTFSNLEEGSHVITVRGTATADPTRTGTYNVRVSVSKPNKNFRVNGRYTLSSTNKLTLRISATEEASFRCRIIKHSPPPPFTTAWIPCSDRIMYTNMTCGLFTAEIEATSISNPSTQSLLRLRQIVIPCEANCSGAPQLQGTASISVDAPNATLNVNLNGPAVLSCRLNNAPEEICYDQFTYTNLAVKNHTLKVTATSACDPNQQIVYRTTITIGAPVDGGWGSWISLPCSVPDTRCGVGTRTRVRGCINPQPQNGGKLCKGNFMDTRSCGAPCNDTSQTLSVTGQYQISGNDVQVFFNASLPASFRCKLDGNPPVSCVSGHTFGNLSVGKHQIQVIARLNSNPQIRKTLKLQRFNIQPPPTTPSPPPPPPHVTAQAQVFDNCSARLTFSANITATYRCRINGGPWEACSSGYLATNLQSGINKIEIEATGTENPNVKTIGIANIDLTKQKCPLLDINHPVCNPSVIGDSFTLTFEATIPNVEYSCKLNNKRPRPCNDRTVTYSNLKKKKINVVTVTATTTEGETVSKNFTFVSKYNRKFCQVYECSGGVVVNGNSAMVAFISDDPGATFKCKLNGKKIRRCASPLQLENLSPGAYTLDVTPTCARNAKGKKQRWTFTIA